MMRYAIALNGGFFTAQRMIQEYLAKAYDLQAQPVPPPGLPESTATAVTLDVAGARR
jgi:hypothetical protein